MGAPVPSVNDLGNFGADVSAFVRKTRLRADLVLRKVGFDCYAGIIMATPVDTARARASWHIAVNRTNLATEAPRKSKGSRAQGPTGLQTGESAAEMGKAKFGDSIYITNNLPYVVPLEHGYSKQARDPDGMVRKTIVRIASQFHTIVNTIKGQTP